MRTRWLGTLLLGAVTLASAQAVPWYLVTAPTDNGCMRDVPATPVAFPPDAREDEGGVVRVRMTFASARAAPSVEVYTNTAGPPFGAAVLAHVAAYRWRCPPTNGETAVVLTQEFQFVPRANRLVIIGGYWRSSRQATSAIGDCEKTIPPPPPYPSRWSLSNAPENGAVLVKLTFRGPGEPVVAVMTEGAPGAFVRIAREHAASYRVRCADPSVYPVDFRLPYRFVLEGTVRYAFRPSTLKDFLGSVESIETERVRFDFQTMDCPFDVQLSYWQPHDVNRAYAEGDRLDDRREFLEWLGRLKLRTSDQRARNDLAGTSLKIHVPCLVLNLL